MTKNELLRDLRRCISTSERQALVDMDSKLVIGKYNRRSMLELLEMEEAGEQVVDADKVGRLRSSLQTYLDQYMEQTEGHKWVILASVFHAFVLDMPLHPLEVAKIKTVQADDRIEYYCPCRDTSVGSLCHFCVCRKYEGGAE